MIRRVGGFAWARRATALGFLALLVAGGRAETWWFRGSTTATEVLGVVRLTDPLAALEVSLASGQIATDVLLGAAILLAVAALLGPVFCGWVCPLGFLLDLNEGLRTRVAHVLGRALGRPALRSPQLTLPSDLRFAVLGLVVGLAVVARLPVFQSLSPINLVGWAAAFVVGPGLLVVLAILVVDHVAPRFWCRSMCPLGAVYSVAGWFAPLRVRVAVAEAGRTPCQLCTRHCPMGVRVMEDYAMRGRRSVDALECTRCGACTDACPRGVLRLGFRDVPDPVDPPAEVPEAADSPSTPRLSGAGAVRAIDAQPLSTLLEVSG